MKKIVLVLFALFVVVCSVNAQPNGDVLKLSIKTDKAVYKTGEPIFVEYTIVNSSDEPVLIDPPFSDEGIIDPNTFSGTFYIQRQGDKNSIDVFPMADISWERFRSVEIAPHGVYQKKINIIGMIERGASGEIPYSSNLFLYKGGRYEIIGKFVPRLIKPGCWKKSLESEIVFITIEGKKYISKDEALRIAKRACLQSGWVWKDVQLTDRASEGLYIVVTNASKRNGYVEIHIEKTTGRVLRKFRKD
ncbi:MAG: hypothetical protein ABIC68_04105 [Candidatus Omnitrophota bacterium]